MSNDFAGLPQTQIPLLIPQLDVADLKLESPFGRYDWTRSIFTYLSVLFRNLDVRMKENCATSLLYLRCARC